jgi:tRNA A-37 threonylcarbamoyl transferase component Bud32
MGDVSVIIGMAGSIPPWITGVQWVECRVMKDYPVAPDQLSAEWLTKALGFPVTDFDIAPLGEGVGIMALVSRVRVRSPDRAPVSVIVKFPSPSADNRAVAHTYDMYGKEVRFYQKIAPAISMRTPACHYAAFDPTNDDFVLVMEDVGHMRIGDQVAGCTLEEAKRVLSAVAALHAEGWQPDHIEGLASHNNPAQRDGMIGGWQVGWPVVKERFPDLIPPAALATGDRMPDAVGRLLEEMCREPVCLIHTDVRLDNVFFGDDEIVFVDWQAVCTSAPEQDVAYFVTQSVAPEVRAQDDLVKFYHGELTGHGIDYSLDRCRERYRVSALYLLCFAVVIAGTLDLANERGARLGRTLLRNAFAALDEMDAFALLN